jgi:tetratricopeptide (TPR) repeat protein
MPRFSVYDPAREDLFDEIWRWLGRCITCRGRRSAPLVTEVMDASSALDHATRSWYQPKGLVAALVLAIVLSALVIPAGISYAAICFGAAIIAIPCAWLVSRRVPKFPRGKIGFAVAITCEDEAMRRRVVSDFIITLRTLIKGSPSGKKFNFIGLPEHIAARVVDAEDAHELRKKARCHFIVYGRVRERRVGPDNRYVFNLSGLVAHAPLKHDAQKNLAREFTELFPREVGINDNAGFLGFEFTTKWAHIVAKYVIGLAMALSSFFEEADPMLAEAQALAAKIPGSFPAFERIKGRVPMIRAAMQASRARVSYERWRDRDKNLTHIEEMKHHLDEAAKLDPSMADRPFVLILRSIAAFLLERDSAHARHLLDRIPKPARESVWHFNRGFLYAYEGNLKKATQCYAQGAQLTVEAANVTELELFVEWAISQDPQHYQLYYSLGLLNRNLKGDKASAIRDFESFLQRVPPTKYLGEQRAVRSWIARLKRDSAFKSPGISETPAHLAAAAEPQ